ncbi:hypothetical protein GQ53DRAFT_156492 [Thozetella sp. PMI_491]|nr:hypothetical protein GQ53DRAFT_156492 [Thozetella sp. PMI_491]
MLAHHSDLASCLPSHSIYVCLFLAGSLSKEDQPGRAGQAHEVRQNCFPEALGIARRDTRRILSLVAWGRPQHASPPVIFNQSDEPGGRHARAPRPSGWPELVARAAGANAPEAFSASNFPSPVYDSQSDIHPGGAKRLQNRSTFIYLYILQVPLIAFPS